MKTLLRSWWLYVVILVWLVLYQLNRDISGYLIGLIAFVSGGIIVEDDYIKLVRSIRWNKVGLVIMAIIGTVTMVTNADGFLRHYTFWMNFFHMFGVCTGIFIVMDGYREWRQLRT